MLTATVAAIVVGVAAAMASDRIGVVAVAVAVGAALIAEGVLQTIRVRHAAGSFRDEGAREESRDGHPAAIPEVPEPDPPRTGDIAEAVPSATGSADRSAPAPSDTGDRLDTRELPGDADPGPAPPDATDATSGAAWSLSELVAGPADAFAPQCPACGRFGVARAPASDEYSCVTCGSRWTAPAGCPWPPTTASPSSVATTEVGSTATEGFEPDGLRGGAPSRLRIRGLWVPKAGASEHEWEDGFAYDEATGRLALSDGASSAVASGSWAEALVGSFVHTAFDPVDEPSFDPWLRAAQATWERPLTTSSPVEDTPWWMDAVVGQPSWATVVFASVAPHPETTWLVSIGAVGDSCAFAIRDGQLRSQLPDMGPHDFDSHPELLGTDGSSVERAVGAYTSAHLSAMDGDTLLLASDALAEWALNEASTRADVWQLLCAVDNAGLRTLVTHLRDRGAIVNDDVTLVRCSIGVN